MPLYATVSAPLTWSCAVTILPMQTVTGAWAWRTTTNEGWLG